MSRYKRYLWRMKIKQQKSARSWHKIQEKRVAKFKRKELGKKKVEGEDFIREIWFL